MDDLLTGYGSDSDESSSSRVGESANGETKKKNDTSGISNLLGDGVDSCSSSSSDDEELPLKKKARSQKDNISNQINDEKNDSFLSRNGLPLPRILPAAPDQSASMVLWKTDYLSNEPQPPTDAKSTDNLRFSKFEKMVAAQEYDSQRGWAAHLRKQNEFHNPHYIQSVIEHFGIKEILGSQAVDTTNRRER